MGDYVIEVIKNDVMYAIFRLEDVLLGVSPFGRCVFGWVACPLGRRTIVTFLRDTRGYDLIASHIYKRIATFSRDARFVRPESIQRTRRVYIWLKANPKLE